MSGLLLTGCKSEERWEHVARQLQKGADPIEEAGKHEDTTKCVTAQASYALTLAGDAAKKATVQQLASG